MAASPAPVRMPSSPRPDTSPAADWCIDQDTRDNVIARRNVLAALWAGRLMGLSEAEITAYAVQVHLVDFEMTGDADVVGKLARDLAARGHAVDPSAIRAQLQAFHAQALREASATD